MIRTVKWMFLILILLLSFLINLIFLGFLAEVLILQEGEDNSDLLETIEGIYTDSTHFNLGIQTVTYPVVNIQAKIPQKVVIQNYFTFTASITNSMNNDLTVWFLMEYNTSEFRTTGSQTTFMSLTIPKGHTVTYIRGFWALELTGVNKFFEIAFYLSYNQPKGQSQNDWYEIINGVLDDDEADQNNTIKLTFPIEVTETNEYRSYWSRSSEYSKT